jgi:hypothetical protein
LYSGINGKQKGMSNNIAGSVKTFIFNGIIQILLSLYWVWHFGRLLYLYLFTDTLFSFMYPVWTLVLFILIAVLGITIGMSVLLGKRKIKTGYLQLTGLFVIGLIVNIIVVS